MPSTFSLKFLATTFLQHLISGMIDISKLQTVSTIEMEIVPTPLMELLEAALNVVSALALAKNLSLELVVDPASVLPETIMTDPNRLKQVLIALLSNGIKFTQKGKVQLIVSRQSSSW